MSKKTLVLGASLKEDRYSNIAINRLRSHDIPTIAIGMKEGTVAGVEIYKELVPFKDVHTVTLYLNPARQTHYYKYILSLNPQRVIFNPGTENPDFYKMLQEQGVKHEIACTLVLLATQQY